MQVDRCLSRLGFLGALVLLLLACAGSAAWAQAPTDAGGRVQKAVEDCNSDDFATRLAGCTLLINEAKLNAGDLGVAHSRRSDSYLDTGEIDKAIGDRAKAFELQPDDLGYKKRLGEAHRLRAVVARAKGRHNEALADYAEAIRIDPSNAHAYGGRGELFDQRKEIAKAEADFRKAADLEDGEPYRAHLSKIHEGRAAGHVLKKNYDAALIEYTEAIGYDAANAKLHADRGAMRAKTPDVDGAIKDYSEAIRLKPELVEAYILRGELFRAHGALPRALADFDDALKRDPKNATALIMRALTREEAQQRDGAISDYRAVLQIDSANAAAKSGLSRLGSTALK